MAWASRSAASARRSALWRASSSWPGRPSATRSSSSIRSIADSRRATTAAASSSSATELPCTPGSMLVSRSSTTASASARAASRRASSASTHGVGSIGRKTTSVPAVRQPSQGWGSGSSAWRIARTTTGCCARMRCSIRFIGSSKPRSSRKSEKSKPSSSLTGTNTASSGNVWPSACRPLTSTRPAASGRVAGLEEAPPGLRGGRHGRRDQRGEERLAEDVGGGPAEEQLSGLGPLGDRSLAVGEHEVAADDLPQDVVERIRGARLLGQGRVVCRERIHGGGSSLLAPSIGRTRPGVQPFVEKNGRGARVERGVAARRCASAVVNRSS